MVIERANAQRDRSSHYSKIVKDPFALEQVYVTGVVWDKDISSGRTCHVDKPGYLREEDGHLA